MKIIALFFLIFITVPLSAKVEPPNYNFSLDTFNDFWPGASLTAIEKKYGKGLLVKNIAPIKTYKFSVEQLRYKFPVFIQVYQGKILDFYGRLPTYFLHDIFHQSIINRYGVQDIYKKIEQNAIYIWKNKKNARIIYSGTCTITCFPIYFTGITTTPPAELGKYQSLFKQFASQLRPSFE